MIIKKLFLKNFRNYIDLTWYPHNYLNLITGDNAQGKTNLLESVYFCTSGRSFRTSWDKEMINRQEQECSAGVEIESGGSLRETIVKLNKTAKTAFFFDGSRQSKNKIFQPGFSISFTPEDLDLITGSPSGRRKWMDYELGPFDVQYLFNLNKYEKVLAQRNNLLKKNYNGPKLNDLIEPWNEQLFNYGSKLVMSRISLLKAIFPYLKESFSSLTAGKEDITFKYMSSIPLEKGMSPEQLRSIFEKTVKTRFNEEVARQKTLFGPHRDDIFFLINGQDTKKFSSRGQQRSLVLSLKLALRQMFHVEYKEYPVIILDDVLFELDKYRQYGLDNLLNSEGQVFVTANFIPAGCFSRRSGMFRVIGGKIFREE